MRCKTARSRRRNRNSSITLNLLLFSHLAGAMEHLGARSTTSLEASAAGTDETSASSVPSTTAPILASVAPVPVASVVSGDRLWRSLGLWLPHARKRAALRGLDAIFKLAMEGQNFSVFGNDAIQCFYDAAVITGEPVRR